MKKYYALLLFLALVSCHSTTNKKQVSSTPPQDNSEKKVLFICTNVNTVNGQPNGTFLSEIGVPFILLRDQGFDIDILSPEGGAIPIYYKFDTTEVIQLALDNSYYQQQTQHSLAPQEVDPQDYDALVIPGGYGQFWDIHDHQEINTIIAAIYENGGIIGTLGHGTSSLVNVELSNGEPLVKGKRMTCFPSWFEKEYMVEADYGTLLPFDMEAALIAKGANLKIMDKATRSNAEIVDAEHRLITASLANSGAFIAAELLQLMEE